MKVLIISDNEDTINFFDSYMKNKSYDVIFYKWIIKAIDNIEEIKPDIIVISSAEYPRHWKTLASFVQSGIGGNNIKLYLYEPVPLSDEEQKKAETLGVTSFITDLSKDKLDIYFPNDEIKNNSSVNYNFDREIILTNPNDGSILSGKIISKDDKNINCRIKSPDLHVGQQIKQVSIYENDKILFLSADVTKNDLENSALSLTVCECYEEI